MEFSWDKLSEKLFQYNELLLTTIIDKKGSTPRGVNTSMIVLPDYSIIGTIGGGPIENEIINDWVQLIKEKKSALLEKFFTGEDVICGGKITVLAEYFSKSDLQLLDTLNKNYLNGNDVYLSRNLQTFEKKLITDYRQAKNLENKKFFIQKIKSLPELFIFGAGHIAVPLAKIAKLCDFNVYIYDDRKDYITKERFPDSKKLIYCDFENINEHINFKNNAFLVLVTREHAHDEIILRQVLGKKYNYIGMIGSKKRVASVKERLINAGFDKSEVENIFAPIGLDINSETPAEIAISILAEIIKKKNEK